jgi:Ca2+-binding RTX toxin-like protein
VHTYVSEAKEELLKRLILLAVVAALTLAVASAAYAAPAEVGTNGPDTLSGDNAQNVIYGLNGNDELAGRRAADELYAGKGFDTVLGGKGADYLNGGKGEDDLFGEVGDDFLDSADGQVDSVSCGDGDDTVHADALDNVDADCETVFNAESI